MIVRNKTITANGGERACAIRNGVYSRGVRSTGFAPRGHVATGGTGNILGLVYVTFSSSHSSREKFKSCKNQFYVDIDQEESMKGRD